MSSPVLLRMRLPNRRGCPNEPARSVRAPRRAWSVNRIILELTRYLTGAVSSSPDDMASADPALRGRLSAVALEPLRAWTAHVVQFRPVAAVHQDGRNGSENGQEIHPRTPQQYPSADFLTVTFDQQKEVMGR